MSVSSRPAVRPFGCETLGRLRSVVLHRPGSALRVIGADDHDRWLFDAPPDENAFNDEHDAYRGLLEHLGVEVIELADYVAEHRPLMARLPNLAYMHDTAVISRHGAWVSAMAFEARRGEEIVVAEALRRMGVPILSRFAAGVDRFEGFLQLSPETAFVADTERHRDGSVERFIQQALGYFREILRITIPRARRYMHPDTIYNRIDTDLALVYPPAFLRCDRYTRSGIEPIDFADLMRRRGVKLVEVTDSEQQRLACSFVPLAPRVVLHYDCALDESTKRRLGREGVELVQFHPEAMLAGGGSLRCLTLRLHRECGYGRR